MALSFGGKKPQSELERAHALLKEADKSTDQLLYSDSSLGLEEYVVSTIRENTCFTIGIKYESGDVIVTAVYPSAPRITYFPNYGPDGYLDFCSSVLQLDVKETFNCSRSVIVEGVKARIYAVMPPLTMHPNITISTTKPIPQRIENLGVDDGLLNDVVHSNFLMVGGSGAGKTYLLNYLLAKFIRDNERIAFIEEFSELTPPNKLCNCLTCPPPKPGQESMLRFMTEQSNLMRLDMLVIGETKGAECWPFLVNLASGTRGATTLHGYSASAALQRMKALCQLATTADAIEEFIAKSINYVIVLERHRVVEIQKLMGTHQRGNYAMQKIYG